MSLINEVALRYYGNEKRQIYMRHGEEHRIDGPSEIRVSGRRQWCNNYDGLYQIQTPSGAMIWFFDGDIIGWQDSYDKDAIMI